MSGVRAFLEDDIPGVVALRAKCFKRSEQASSEALVDHMRSILFDNPWVREDLPSLVCEAKDGSIVGFLGVLPRPMQYQEERLWLAVPTQYMVDPDKPGIVAINLLKAFLKGPQDISMADLSTDVSRKIWESLGGLVAHPYSLYWTRPLRPMAYRASLAGKGGLGAVARPFSKILDQAAAHLPDSAYRFDGPGPEGKVEPIDLDGLLASFGDVAKRYRLSPEYSQESLVWLFDRMERNASTQAVVKARVIDKAGKLSGWYVYVLTRDGRAQVVQLFGQPGSLECVLKHLCRDAWRRGALAVSGRIQPENHRAVTSQPISLSRRGPWMLVESTRPEVREHILAGHALLSRLEGEWWMSF
ncbi:MAG: hypothetical protein AAF495_06035 [Pseudomonadota bacterium]